MRIVMRFGGGQSSWEKGVGHWTFQAKSCMTLKEILFLISRLDETAVQKFAPIGKMLSFQNCKEICAKTRNQQGEWRFSSFDDETLYGIQKLKIFNSYLLVLKPSKSSSSSQVFRASTLFLWNHDGSACFGVLCSEQENHTDKEMGKSLASQSSEKRLLSKINSDIREKGSFNGEDDFLEEAGAR
ncbi:hypothetical protein OIU84_028467 [Salix udensis]|uniref:Uncharacterized protein n=1 Tax=Salix udensis TaxID=889485 RepID=A0AAD6P9D4_9ROSI|nr:hypothetical protein OIU84_028467 [Salix udensis]